MLKAEEGKEEELPLALSTRQAGHRVLVPAFPAAPAGVPEKPLPPGAPEKLVVIWKVSAGLSECVCVGECDGREVGKCDEGVRSAPGDLHEGLGSDSRGMLPLLFLCSSDDRDAVCAILCSPFPGGPWGHHLLRLLLPLLLQ